MIHSRHPLLSCFGLVACLLPALGAHAAEPDPAPAVVMVCEHGAVKSLIAVELFNQEASRRGLPFRAMSRGLDPYPAVPEKISEALKEDGFNVTDFEPRRLSSGDVVSAVWVVSIGADLSAFNDDAMTTILRWDAIPPASVDYEASKAALRTKVLALLDELEKSPQ